MKVTFFLLLSSLSFSVFAQDQEGSVAKSFYYPESPEAITAMKENPCLGDQRQRAVSITGLYNRQKIEGTEHIGVTSFGDVAVLKDNNMLITYSCFRGTGLVAGAPVGDIVLEDAGVNCSTGEILVMNKPGAADRFFHFRSPRFSDQASTCFNRPSDAVSSTERQIQKDEYGFVDGKPMRSSSVFGL